MPPATDPTATTTPPTPAAPPQITLTQLTAHRWEITLTHPAPATHRIWTPRPNDQTAVLHYLRHAHAYDPETGTQHGHPATLHTHPLA